MDSERLLQRFLRYVRIDTTANDASETYPSSAGQWELGRILLAELQRMGIRDAEQDKHGLIWGTVPSNVAAQTPVVAFNSHLDTSPETTGNGVQPQVIRKYAGGDIALPYANKVIRVVENPELQSLIGATIITTDGTTLLGGDDKAGLAVIMEAAEFLCEHPEIPHGPIRILFTCDEEIGRGVQHVDLMKLGADVGYTLDGGGANEIDTETFSADLAVVKFVGINIHPSIAKDRMVNAIRAASEFIARMPRHQFAPEVTSDRQGFLHPYHLEGGVAEVALKVLLRDFETSALAVHAQLLNNIGKDVERLLPGVSVKVEIRKQYRNMADGLRNEPRAVENAVQAHRRLGREPRLTIVRGGTDGSQLTELGLPTPNLSTGQHNPHSPLEWACLDEMVQAVQVLIELVQVWSVC